MTQSCFTLCCLVALLSCRPVAAQAGDHAPAVKSPETVVVTETQGDRAAIAAHDKTMRKALRGAIEVAGWKRVKTPKPKPRFAACSTPECVQKELRRAKADIVIVPALWRPNAAGPTALNYTLTLIDRSGRRFNAEHNLAIGPANTLSRRLRDASDALIAKLSQHAGLSGSQAPTRPLSSTLARPPSSKAWLAGPIVLGAVGLGALGAGIGMAAAGDTCTNRNQDLCLSSSSKFSNGAVATTLITGALAGAGSIVWAVVGARRRNRNTQHVGVDIEITSASFRLSLRKVF